MVARDVMHADPLSVVVTTSFLELQHLLVVAHVSGVPVVDADGAVVGIVSATDLVRAADQLFDEDRDPDEPDDLADRFRTLTARDLATPEVVWVTPDTPVEQVAERMRTDGIHRVLVGDHGRLEGILTAYDLLQVVASRPSA